MATEFILTRTRVGVVAHGGGPTYCSRTVVCYDLNKSTHRQQSIVVVGLLPGYGRRDDLFVWDEVDGGASLTYVWPDRSDVGVDLYRYNVVWEWSDLVGGCLRPGGVPDELWMLLPRYGGNNEADELFAWDEEG